MRDPCYCIITPARNEGKFLQDTVNSVVAQTHRPIRWIIVDDGSSDDTGGIADEAARRYDWISVVHRNDRGARHAGGGVMEAFGDGLKLLDSEQWHYLVKLDGDVTFEQGYFERCFERFAVDERLGIGGGLICTLVDGTLHTESKLDPSFMFVARRKFTNSSVGRQLVAWSKLLVGTRSTN
jgi:biofilm PGA synthesis N-glycosyltransferase PgaC